MAGRTAICESPVDEDAPGALLADPRKPASGAGGAIWASAGMPSAGGTGAEKEDSDAKSPLSVTAPLFESLAIADAAAL